MVGSKHQADRKSTSLKPHGATVLLIFHIEKMSMCAMEVSFFVATDRTSGKLFTATMQCNTTVEDKKPTNMKPHY